MKAEAGINFMKQRYTHILQYAAIATINKESDCINGV